MKLVIGYYNYSSWSMRGYLLAKLSALPFSTEFVAFSHDDRLQRMAKDLGAPAKVPLLIADEGIAWDSLAIAETLAERAPGQIWPVSPALRARARSMAAELHSGFFALRGECPMNIRQRRQLDLSSDASADVSRINALLSDALTASEGPFLCGPYSAVDAYYAPILMRYLGYGIAVPEALRGWAHAMLERPSIEHWIDCAMDESFVLVEDQKGALLEDGWRPTLS
ncbi:glutathione S-transferase [Gammaproteobacteria bacterium]|nr:glutathione S-transferase [Gammaproteobacteria bacterium]